MLVGVQALPIANLCRNMGLIYPVRILQENRITVTPRHVLVLSEMDKQSSK